MVDLENTLPTFYPFCTAILTPSGLSGGFGWVLIDSLTTRNRVAAWTEPPERTAWLVNALGSLLLYVCVLRWLWQSKTLMPGLAQWLHFICCKLLSQKLIINKHQICRRGIYVLAWDRSVFNQYIHFINKSNSSHRSWHELAEIDVLNIKMYCTFIRYKYRLLAFSFLIERERITILGGLYVFLSWEHWKKKCSFAPACVSEA